MEERRDALPFVVVEHRHLSFTSPTPKHLHWEFTVTTGQTILARAIPTV